MFVRRRKGERARQRKNQKEIERKAASATEKERERIKHTIIVVSQGSRQLERNFDPILHGRLAYFNIKKSNYIRSTHSMEGLCKYPFSWS